MSHWGATVITNLLSAIPVFGKDFVELIWKIGLILNIIIIYNSATGVRHLCNFEIVL